jgi:hypothetical protein
VNNPRSVLDKKGLPKVTRSGEAHPGSMTVFIRQVRLLPDDEIDYLCNVALKEIVRNQE